MNYILRFYFRNKMNTYTCPITLNTISDPVTCPDGHTYERKALEKWVRQMGKSPMNPSLPLSLDQIVTNYAFASLLTTPIVSNLEQTDKVEYLTPTFYLKMQDDATCITVVNPEEGNRLPRDIVFIVDKSGSMQVGAIIQTAPDVIPEDHGLSVWDITIHSVITGLHTMCSNDRASIVLFSNTADVLLTLQPMTDQIRNSAIASLKKNNPTGGTNIHIGIKTALHILDSREDKSREATILLFTDGQPNERPPLGELAEFKRYVQKNEGMSPTLHTFGFGNNLMSDLLYDLSVAGKGSYNFIPDSSFLGTIFVNALANIFASYTSAGSVIYNSETHEIGPMQYGQERWIMSKSIPDESKDAFLTFTQQGKLITVAESKDILSKDDYADIISRNWYIDTLKKCIQLCIKNEFFNAHNEIYICKKHIRKTKYGNALLADLDGEVSKAVTKIYFNKWGKHWMFSILRAHELQICNNFLDPGVQLYGGNLYRELVEKANDIFNSLPPPESSAKRPNIMQCRSMEYYNNPTSGSCFPGENMVKMSDGKLKKVKNVIKGDKVQTEFGQATVVCVLKTKCSNNEADLVEVFTKNSSAFLTVTPYHPILWEGTWIHPNSLPRSVSRRLILNCDAVYSFLLDKEHTMIINNVVVISMAHERTEGVLEHWFYGTQKVKDFMTTCPGWEDGLIVLNDTSTVRDKNGTFVGLKLKED